MTANHILSELESVRNTEKALFLKRFFKTGKGQYGEGDIFLGIVVPVVRLIAKANRQTPLTELDTLIRNSYHEARLCALIIAVQRFKKATEEEKADLHHFYLSHTDYINNWDLVDLSCPTVIGEYLLEKDRTLLYQMAQKQHLCEQRIAIVSTHAFIRQNDFTDTFALCKLLMNHRHDLIHKACGWMLREIGKRKRPLLTDFLENYAVRLPRTTLRYAIEHYPENERQHFLKRK